MPATEPSRFPVMPVRVTDDAVYALDGTKVGGQEEAAVIRAAFLASTFAHGVTIEDALEVAPEIRGRGMKGKAKNKRRAG